MEQQDLVNWSLINFKLIRFTIKKQDYNEGFM